MLRTQNVSEQKSETFFVYWTQNLCPQQMLRARANGETFVSATMCPRLPAPLKAAKYADTKTINLSRNIVSLQVFADVSRFSPCVINLSRNKNICCGLKKVVVKSRAQVYFEQQILALLLVFHQTHNLSCNKFARALANQPISAPHFFNPEQMFLLRVKVIKQGEKRETSTKTCNETMLRDKLRVFVSRISPPNKTETAGVTSYKKSVNLFNTPIGLKTCSG